jgi:hypothetical protein
MVSFPITQKRLMLILPRRQEASSSAAASIDLCNERAKTNGKIDQISQRTAGHLSVILHNPLHRPL